MSAHVPQRSARQHRSCAAGALQGHGMQHLPLPSRSTQEQCFTCCAEEDVVLAAPALPVGEQGVQPALGLEHHVHAVHGPRRRCMGHRV